MQQKAIQQATAHLPSTTTGPEDEPYILTPEEEKEAIEYAVVYRAKNLKLYDGEPDNRLERAAKYFDEEKIKKLLKQCNSNKHQQLWHEEQRLKRINQDKERQEALIKKCTANYFFNLLKKNSIKPLIRSEETMPYLETLCYFLSNDSRLAYKLNLDMNKGLWIRGAYGVGKTFPLMCLQNNELIPFQIHSMLTIANEVAENGSYEINEPLKVIDDVGSEQSVVNHYGTKKNWFKDFIELYYAEQKPFNRLIITTNFDFEQVEKSYGSRVRSRVKDMFNIVDVKGEDLRGSTGKH
jgi:DNA replication protein DnaC